jgi:hypothetical protein
MKAPFSAKYDFSLFFQKQRQRFSPGLALAKRPWQLNFTVREMLPFCVA